MTLDMTLTSSFIVAPAWRRAAVAAVVLMVALGVTAPRLALPGLLVISGLLAGCAGLAVARHARGIDRSAWALLGLGQLANGLGNLTFVDGDGNWIVAASWTVTAVFNLGTLVTVMGMFAFVAPSGNRRRLVAFAADSVMVCGCAFVVIWVWQLTDYVGAINQKGTVLGALAVLGLVLDLMGLALVPAIVRSRPRGQRGAVWLAAVALVIAAIGDLDQALSAVQLPAELAPLGWLLSSCLLLVGATLVHRTAERNPRRHLRGPMDLTSTAILATTLTLLLGGRTLDAVARVALLALTVLILARHAVVYSSNRRLRRELQYQAYHDRLTGLPNRSNFERGLANTLDAASTATVLFCDLDGFKEINDTYGHAAGDAVLTTVGRRLHTAVGPAQVFRLGGDEFTALLPVSMSREEVALLTKTAQRAVAQPIQYRERSLAVTLSVGVSWRGGSTAEEVMMQADLSLHAAKRLGRNRFLFYHDELRQLASRRYYAESRLGAAMSAGDLRMVYQPIHRNPALTPAVGSHERPRFEALLRWPDQLGGTVLPPNEVVELVETLGRTRELTSWAVSTVFDQLQDWRRLGVDAEVALNLTAAQLRSVQLLELIQQHSRRTGVAARQLIAEVTESEVAGDDDITATLRQLQDSGIQVSLDDFGTGYSNFTTVIALPIDDLKLDQTFLSGPQQQGRRRRVMAAVVHLAHDVGLSVTVEGIETREQYLLAVELGADHLQGFLLGRPGPAESFLGEFTSPPSAGRPPVQPNAGP